MEQRFFYIDPTMATVISIVSYPFLPARVGGQKGVALFNTYFGKYHRLICVTTRRNDPAEARGYELLNILSNSPLRYINLFYFFTLRKLIRSNQAEFLLIEHPYLGWLGLLLKYLCGVKLIIHSHNIEGLRWKTLGKWWWPVLWRYEKFSHRRADFNFFIHDDDRDYAIDHFRLQPARCLTMTYGIEWDQLPAPPEIQACRERIRGLYGIGSTETVLLFNGAFNYSPNLEALRVIAEQIHPLLRQRNFPCRIIICGRDIPPDFNEAKFPGIIFAGFVDDISLYFKAADVFLNPITQGGGIKTKLVEALGYNLNAVSTTLGATGIEPAWCNGKLFLCQDSDWEAFAKAVEQAARYRADMPPVYFEHFYWGFTTKKAAAFIEHA